jgi:outer membrane usher protein
LFWRLNKTVWLAAGFVLLIRPGGAADLAAPASTVQGQGSATELLLLVETVDSGRRGTLERVLQTPDGRLWLRREAFAQWRLQSLAGETYRHAGHEWIAIDSVTGIHHRLDAATQTLEIELRGARRELGRYSLDSAHRLPVDPASPGGFLNFDVQHTGTPTGDQTAALVEGGYFNRFGRGGQTFLWRDNQPLRLDTFWSIEDPARMTTLRIGDSLGRSGLWGRTVRYGGIQWATDFGLAPYFTTFPLPAISGDAVQPSTLDVFVGETLRGRQEIEPGPFELQEVPVLSGAGEVQVVMRDLLGRETVITQPYYTSPRLLRAGLTDTALEAGWLRRDYGITSLEYGDFFGAMTLRRGLSDDLTGEVRIEGQAGRASFGGSGLWLLGDLVLASGTLAYGRGALDQGAMAIVGLERHVPRRYGLALRTQLSESGFAQLGDAPGFLPPRRRDFASASVQPHDSGTVAVAWTQDDRRDGPDISVLSATYRLRIARDWFLGLTGLQTRQARTDHAVLAGVSVLLGGRASAEVQGEFRENRDAFYRASFQQNPEGPLGFGYRATTEQGATGREMLSASWSAEQGRVSADVQHDPTGASYRLGLSTALASTGNRMFWTRPVNGSFAVVDTQGLEGVRVYADNQLVGRTDRQGTALVPGLRAYQLNALSLDANDIPLQYRVDELSRTVVPRTSSGVHVSFPLNRRVNFLLRVMLPDGQPLPAGSQVQDAADGTPYPVGDGGAVLVYALPGARQLNVTVNGRGCSVTVQVPSGTVPAQGPQTVQCAPSS